MEAFGIFSHNVKCFMLSPHKETSSRHIFGKGFKYSSTNCSNSKRYKSLIMNTHCLVACHIMIMNSKYILFSKSSMLYFVKPANWHNQLFFSESSIISNPPRIYFCFLQGNSPASYLFITHMTTCHPAYKMWLLAVPRTGLFFQ